MIEYLLFTDPRAATMPGYAEAAAELKRCAARDQDVSDATVRIEDGRIVAVGNVWDIAHCEN